METQRKNLCLPEKELNQQPCNDVWKLNHPSSVKQIFAFKTNDFEEVGLN